MARYVEAALGWLHQQDVALFRWINGTWSNSLLDSVMPFLSGNRFFMPAAVLTALLLIWRGRLRGFLCVAIVLTAIAVGDGFIYPVIKSTLARERPFQEMPEAVLRIGSANSNSMPSSHAANWTCLAVVAFAFYRRSAWITVPLGLLVGVSRVYNGVHYPSDVLIGMLAGAGCGAAVLATLDSAWAAYGRRWFPIWWAKLPSIVQSPASSENEPEEEPRFRDRDGSEPVTARHATVDEHWIRLGYVLIAVTLLARLIFLAVGPMQLSPDEAYQWHWSKHLDLSYLSKPPLIAYAQFAGTAIWGDTAFGVRFLSPLIAAALGLMMLQFFAREVNARAGFFMLLVLTTTPMMAAGAVLMTVDPLSVLFWTAAMLAGWKAVQDKSTPKDWLWVGLWMGLGLLSKYTALFQLLCWAVFFWLWPGARKQLKRPGPWLALLLLALCALPIVIWNHQHGWVTIAHVAEDAGAGKAWKPTLRYFGEFIGAEFGLLNPVYFVGCAWAAVTMWKRGRSNPKLVYFFSMGVPLFLVYLLFSFKSRTLPNWIAPSIIPLFCLGIIYWDTRLRLGQTQVKAWLNTGLAIGTAAVLIGHDTSLLQKLFKVQLPPRMDPLRRVLSWTETASRIENVRQRMAEEGKPVFIIGDHYGITSELSFYISDARRAAALGRPFVYCRTSERPRNQFHLWPSYLNRKGENAIFVRELSPGYKQTYPVPVSLKAEFESIEELGVRPVIAKGQKEPIRHLHIFFCRGLK